MREILKMVIEPEYCGAARGLSENLIVQTEESEQWRLYWLPILGFSSTPSGPISLDSIDFSDTVAKLKNRFFRLKIGMASGEKYIFAKAGMTPKEAMAIHKEIQKAYWQFLKHELPGHIAAR